MKSHSLSLAFLVYAQVVASIVVAALCAVQVFATRQYGIQSRTIQNFESRLALNRQALGMLLTEAQKDQLLTKDKGLAALLDSLRTPDPAATNANSTAQSSLTNRP